MNQDITIKKNKTNGRHGVLLLNMGGPRSEDELRSYLFRLFSDRYIIDLPGVFRIPLAGLIAFFRKPKAAERYRLIGGASPLDRETALQAEKLADVLGFPVTYAMRYVEPTVETALAKLMEQKVSHLVVLPLYPQYSKATTESVLKHVKQYIPDQCRHLVVTDHHDYPGYIATMSQLLAESMKTIANDIKTEVVFVAHSIPLKQLHKGDPYVDQVRETVARTAEKTNLPCPWSLSFQSRVGPVKWQGPALEETLARLVKEGVKQVVVQPVSFVCENLETLFDLDIQFKQDCNEAGIQHYIRVPAPGTHQGYIDTLASLTRDTTAHWDTAQRKTEGNHG